MAKAKATAESGASAPDAETVADVLAAADLLGGANSSPGTPEEQAAAALAGAAPVFAEAAALPPTLAAQDADAIALDKARADAEAMADELNANPLPVERLRIEFPALVIIRNNSIISLSEMVTGAFLQPGGFATVTLHDEDHADAVAESLSKLVEENYLPRDAVTVGLA